MNLCKYCGKEIDDGAAFCPSCGTPVSIQQSDSHSKRKQEYVGNVRKCPACGEELPSFTAICPSCGHEINSQSVSSTVKKFIDAINECDGMIANDPEPPRTGWKTWSKGVQVAWVILNLVTLCLPLVVYLALPLLKPFIFSDKVPALSVGEKQKAALIENSIFPNEREATVEAMMFIKSKIAFLATERFNEKTLYWANIWYTKAEQLNHRANIILKNDETVKLAYTDSVATLNEQIQKIDKTPL